MTISTKNKAIKKVKAKRLYVNQYYTAKAAAIAIGVSEKTFGNWIRENNWKDARTENENKQLSDEKTQLATPNITIEDLKSYIKENSPNLSLKVNPIIDAYLKLIS